MRGCGGMPELRMAAIRHILLRTAYQKRLFRNTKGKWQVHLQRNKNHQYEKN